MYLIIIQIFREDQIKIVESDIYYYHGVSLSPNWIMHCNQNSNPRKLIACAGQILSNW